MSSFKPTNGKKQGSGNGPKLDYDYIAGQVEDGLSQAICSNIIDLGEHKQPIQVTNKTGFMLVEDEEAAAEILGIIRDAYGDKKIDEDNLDDIEELEEGFVLQFKVVKNKWVFSNSEDDYTYFETLEEAEEALEAAKQIDNFKFVEKDGKDEIIKMEDCVKLPFRTFIPDNAREVTYTFDLVENDVEYIKGSGETAQYRLYASSEFKGAVRGIVTPDDGRTYSPNSVTAKIAAACGVPEIVDTESDDCNDIGLLLGQPCYIDVKKKDSFIKVGAYSKPKAKALANFEELQVEPAILTFDNATPELLDLVKPKYVYVNKIKAAINYEGSPMQEAMEAWEAGKTTPTVDTKTEEEAEEDAPVDVEEAPKPKTPKKKATAKKKVVEEEEESDDPWGE
jgi:hypothetical protein